MNITDSKSRYRITDRQVYDQQTKTGRIVDNLPSLGALSLMHGRTFVRGCKYAIEHGIWPTSKKRK